MIKEKKASYSNQIRRQHDLSIINLIIVWLASIAIIGRVSGHGCFDTKFPRILGGTSGFTSFHSFDIDQFKNVIIGGTTSDPGIASLQSSQEPIALLVESGGRVKWAFSFRGNGYIYNYVSQIAFEETMQTQAAVVLQSQQQTQSFTVVIINAGTGGIIKQFKDFQGGLPKQTIQTTLKFISPTNMIATFAIDKQWTFLGIKPTLTTPLQFCWRSLVPETTSSIFGAQDVIVDPTGLQAFITGLMVDSNFDNYMTISSHSVTDGSVAWIQGLIQPTTPYFSGIRLTYYVDTLLQHFIWSCATDGSSIHRINVIQVDPANGFIIIGGFEYIIAMSQTCQAIKVTSDSTFLIFSSKGPNVSLNNFNIATGQQLFYNFENTLNQGITNLVYQAKFLKVSPILDPILAFVGQATTFSNLGISLATYSNTVGYMMSLNPEMQGIPQTINCINNTITFSVIGTLTQQTTSLTGLSPGILQNFPGSNYMQILSGFTISTILPLINLAQIPQLCVADNPPTLYQFSDPDVIPDITYMITSPINTNYIVSQFGVVQSGIACPDARFVYSVRFNGSQIFPAWFNWNLNTMTMSWGGVTNAQISTSLIEIQGDLSDGNSQIKYFNLIIKPNCANAVLTPQWQSLYRYYFDTTNPNPLVMQINFLVTSDVSVVDCGGFTFQLDQLDSTTPPTLDSTIYTWSPITSSSVQTLSVLPTILSPTIDNFNMKVFQGSITLNMVSKIFNVQFVSSCLGSIFSPISGLAISYTMNNIASIVNVDQVFSSQIFGCLQYAQYTCLSGCVPISIRLITQPSVAVGSLSYLYVTSSDYTLVGTHIVMLQAINHQDPTISATTSITVNIISDCPFRPIIIDPLSPAIYDVSFGFSVTLGQLQAITSSTMCTNQIVLELIDKDTLLMPDTTVFTLNSLKILILNTQDPLKAKIYNLQIRAHIPIGGGPTYTYNFTVQVTDKCPGANIVTSVIDQQKFTLGDPELVVYFNRWSDNVGGFCGEIQHEAKMIDDKPLDGQIIKFDSNLRKFSVYTTDPKKHGLHKIKLLGRLPKNGKISIVQFTLEVFDPCVTSLLTPSIIQDITYQVGQGPISHVFQSWQDSLGYCGPPKYETSISPTPKIPLFALDSLNRAYRINVLDGYDQSPETSFTVRLSGVIRGGAKAETQFILTIRPKVPLPVQIIERNVTLKNSSLSVPKFVPLVPNITPQLSKVDYNGIATIMFSKEMNFTSNFTLLRDKVAFTIVVEFRTGQRQNQVIDQWDVIEASRETMKIRIVFPRPNEISLTTNYDFLRIKILEPNFFISKDFLSTVKKDYIIFNKIPPQITQSSGQQALQSFQGAIGSSLVASLGSNLLLCLILGVSLNNVWQLMNMIQLLTLIPLFKLPIPPSYLSLSRSLLDFSNFDLLPEQLSLKYIRRSIVGYQGKNQTNGRRILQEDELYQKEKGPMKLDVNFEIMDIF